MNGIPLGQELTPGVVIVFWEGYLGASPSIVSAIRMFEDAGFEVQVLTREARKGFPDAPCFGDNTHVEACQPFSAWWRRRGFPGRLPTFFHDQSASRSAVSPSLKERTKALARDLLGSILFAADLIQFRRFVSHHTRHRAPRFWIGVDTIGLVEAGHHCRPERLAYWSLEIVFLDTIVNPILRHLKRAERRVSRRARRIIVQDGARADLLAQENGVDLNRCALVPNAPRSTSRETKSDFLHSRLGISPEKRIVLHLGMMGPEVLSAEIAAASRFWPEDWVLVFHERFSRSLDDPVVKEVLSSGGDRVFLSLEPVDLDDLPNVVASADVGLVFYNPAMGPNYAVITGASGKLAYYLQAGVPVICLDLPGFDELMTDGRCGVCVPSPAAIGSALEGLTPRLPELREAARRCFDERYAFDGFFLPLVEEIKGELHAPG